LDIYLHSNFGTAVTKNNNTVSHIRN